MDQTERRSVAPIASHDDRRIIRTWLVLIIVAALLLAAFLFFNFMPFGIAGLGLFAVALFWKLVLDFRDAMEKWQEK